MKTFKQIGFDAISRQYAGTEFSFPEGSFPLDMTVKEFIELDLKKEPEFYNAHPGEIIPKIKPRFFVWSILLGEKEIDLAKVTSKTSFIEAIKNSVPENGDDPSHIYSVTYYSFGKITKDSFFDYRDKSENVTKTKIFYLGQHDIEKIFGKQE